MKELEMPLLEETLTLFYEIVIVLKPLHLIIKRRIINPKVD